MKKEELVPRSTIEGFSGSKGGCRRNFASLGRSGGALAMNVGQLRFRVGSHRQLFEG